MGTIKTAAHQLWQFAHQYRVWCFDGPMGAGKTTLIHAVCDLLGVKDVVSSPTFALLNEYHFKDGHNSDAVIYHMDWYRLRDAAEAINAGMEDALSGGSYCFVEWPAHAEALIPPVHVRIDMEAPAPGERKLTARAG